MNSRLVDVLRLRVRSLMGRARMDDELDRELRAHLEQQIDENVSRGMSPADARRVALSTFGGVENVREEARDARGVAIVENILRDCRYTLRALVRDPLLILAATLSIALGAAGNIAVFSLARAFVFAPPDVRDPGSLVNIQVSHGSHVSYRRWLDIQASGALADIAGYSIEKQLNWLDGDAAVSLVPMIVTANFFDVTGVPVAFGRAFSAAEARAEGDPRVVVVSHEFWERSLRGDSAVIGHKLLLNGEPYVVLGVLRARLRSVAGFGIAPGVYVPLSRAFVPEMADADRPAVQLLGRLKTDQTLSAARAALDAVDRRLAALQGDAKYGGVQQFSRVGSLGTAKAVSVIGGFVALLAVVSGFVLLIACANVAGLLMARAARRRQELAIRLAIGASRGRIIQQLLIEGAWLALIGTVAGVALSAGLMRVVSSVSLPIAMPIEVHLAPDAAVFLCAILLLVLTVVFSALAPALYATGLTLVPALKGEAPFLAVRRFTARGALLSGQVAVSTLLLVTAFLFLRNLTRSQDTNPGFEVRHALVAQIGFAPTRSEEARTAYLDAAAARMSATPGVEQAAYSAVVPLTMYAGSSNGGRATIGRRANPEHVEYSQSLVGAGFFSTLGISVLAGREFESTDLPGTARVAIINAEFARRYFSGASPLGQRIRISSRADYAVVGVVANGKYRTLGEDQRAAIYLPIRQHAEEIEIAFVVARTRGDPAMLVTTARSVVGELDHSVSVSVQPMESALAFALVPSQIGAAVLGTLGILGLLLAAFGVYAIVSSTVSRRVAEIAIRSALGASYASILRLVVRDTSLEVGVGLVLGLALAALVTAPLSAFLVAGLSPTDPVSFVGTALVFLLVSMIASWLPARHATRVSPVIAMRLD